MAKKNITETTKMRSAFYEVVDKLPNLRREAKKTEDPELIRLTTEMEKLLDEVNQKLNQDYIWD